MHLGEYKDQSLDPQNPWKCQVGCGSLPLISASEYTDKEYTALAG